MARGSKPGERRGGRKKGVPNKKTQAKIAEVEASGLTPLDYLLSVIRDESVPRPERVHAANHAAPYVHSRLATTTHTGADGGPIEHAHEIVVTFVKPGA